MYYLQSRYYDPETGRFINADDARIMGIGMNVIGGTNLFSYCLNNPVMDVDPTGEFAFTTMLIIGIVAGALIGGGVKGYSAYKNGGNGLEIAGSAASGALMGAAMGAALMLGGAAGLVATGVTVAGFGLSTAAALGIAVGAGTLAGLGGYSIESAAYKNRQWTLGGCALSGARGGLQALATFGIAYFGGKNGLFNKMAGFKTMDSFYLHLIATKGGISSAASFFYATSALIGDTGARLLYISASAAVARWLIGQLF